MRKVSAPASPSSSAAILSADELRKEAEGWLLTGMIAGWSERTISDRRWWIQRLDTFLTQNGHSFDVDGLRRFFLAISKGTDEYARKPLKPASVKHVHTILTAFGNWLIKEDRLGANPMTKVPAPIMADPGIEPFTDLELIRILDAAKRSRNPERDTALIHLLCECGLRATEITSLRHEDISFNGRPAAGTAFVRAGKGGKTRTVAFHSETAGALWRYIRGLRPPPQPSDFLFQSIRGGPLDRGSLRQLCARLGEVADVKNVHPHRFRHDAAIRLLRNGAHVFQVMSQLGHVRVQTLQIYVRMAEQDVRSMAASASPMDHLKKSRSDWRKR